MFKSDLLNSNVVGKIHILYCFSWKFTFSMSKVNFWIFGFIETKRLNIDYLRTKMEISLSVIGVKFPGGKKKKFVINKVS